MLLMGLLLELLLMQLALHCSNLMVRKLYAMLS